MVDLGVEAIESLKGNIYKTQFPSLKFPTYFEVRNPSYVFRGINEGVRCNVWIDCFIIDSVDRFGTEWVGIRRILPFGEISLYEKVNEEDLPWSKSRTKRGLSVAKVV